MLSIFSQIPDQTAVSEGIETVFRWARIQENRDWFLPLLILVLLIAFFFRRYRYDAAELKLWQRSVLLTLRATALVFLFLFYLHPQWEHLVGNSRVAVLIDSSASMGSRDLQADEPGLHPAPGEGQEEHDTEKSGQEAGPTRLEGVLDWMRRSELIRRLHEKHDVVVYTFDSSLHRVLEKQRAGAAESLNATENDSDDLPTNFDLDSLKPEGEETCLGDALFEVLQRERGRPLAGILLLTDGRQNSGREPDAPLETASRMQIPIFPIGVGVTRQPLNFRVGNIDVPDRAFPDDPFTIRVPIEMLGGEGSESEEGARRNWTIPVQLWSRPIEKEDSPENQAAPESKIGETEVLFSGDSQTGGVILADFEVRFPEPGRHRLSVKILPPQEDRHPEDDFQRADLEIVDRKDRVLLYASGPMRDYQFLCAHIFRDKSMTVDVFLPWTQPGSTQNAERILEQFPSTRTEMSEYDIVIAFDPNWRDLSEQQIDVLENWVARQGGGLILVAGPINQSDTVTGWVTDMAMEKVRALYPVDFLAKQSAFDHRYHGDVQAWPLQFTSAGDDAEFLRPVDNPVEARSFWSGFPGFYGYFAVRGVKPTAILLAMSGAPQATGRQESGALIVEQFYGAGRVLYWGSGEIWRLRHNDDRPYEQIATRMLRHVAQGRLQRESDRGSLATDKRRYTLGSIAQLRVTANDAQLKPSLQPTLPVDVIAPSGTLRVVEVSLDPNVPGSYQAHLPLTEEGTWSIRFSIPESDQRIVRSIQVRMSDLERENPSRNEPLLLRLAGKTGGRYYRSPTESLPMVKESALYGGIDFFRGSDKDSQAEPIPPITELLKIRSQRAVPDRDAEEKASKFFLIAVCSFLMLEWALRRLMKLA